MKLVYGTSALLAILIIGGFVYMYTSTHSAVELDVVQPDVTQEQDQPQGRCPEGFVEHDTEEFNLCYPDDLKLLESTSSGIPVTFSSDAEELKTDYDIDDTWSIHLCNVEEDITVASFSGRRTTFKKETAAGCGRPYRFVTKIEADSDIFTIDLKKRDGTYDSSEQFMQIELLLLFHREL